MLLRNCAKQVRIPLMPSNVTFTSATIHSFGRTAKGGKAKFEFSLTQKAIAAMGWGELPTFSHGSNLDGDLSATAVELIPNDEPLRKHRFTLDSQRVCNFVATRQELENKRGKGHRWTVQCDVLFGDPAGCKKLETYLLNAGKGELRISYEKQPTQTEIPGVEATEDQRQRVLSDEVQ